MLDYRGRSRFLLIFHQIILKRDVQNFFIEEGVLIVSTADIYS